MIGFIVKAFFFNFILSILFGLVFVVICLPLIWYYREEIPRRLSYPLGFSLGLGVCVIQGLMFAAAIDFALQESPERWDAVWYVVGFVFSVPIALAKDLSKDPYTPLGILTAEVAYALGCVFPSFIPTLLGVIAVRFLL